MLCCTAVLQPAGNKSVYDPFRDTIIPSKSIRVQQQQLFGQSINQRRQQPLCCQQQPRSVDTYRQFNFNNNTE
uniref:Uncharacterized protein n=1 Tax=Glossina palpalis gambiensis TaxID=67801 RepID=A0A1B0B785_9MUSC